MCELAIIGAGIVWEGGASVEGAVVTGTLWEVVTVEVIGTGTQVQVLPLAEVEALPSVLNHTRKRLICSITQERDSFAESQKKETSFNHY